VRPLHSNLAKQPEALVVGLARTGDSAAFAELVRRRQSWIRTLMRRCCGDAALADDLAQQAFLKAWADIKTLRKADRFAGWLKQLAINIWRQHARVKDVIEGSADVDDLDLAQHDSTSRGMDLQSALNTLNANVRLCVVLSYHEGMSHAQICAATGLAEGTVKSHIRRGSNRMKAILEAYQPDSTGVAK